MNKLFFPYETIRSDFEAKYGRIMDTFEKLCINPNYEGPGDKSFLKRALDHESGTVHDVCNIRAFNMDSIMKKYMSGASSPDVVYFSDYDKNIHVIEFKDSKNIDMGSIVQKIACFIFFLYSNILYKEIEPLTFSSDSNLIYYLVTSKGDPKQYINSHVKSKTERPTRQELLNNVVSFYEHTTGTFIKKFRNL